MREGRHQNEERERRHQKEERGRRHQKEERGMRHHLQKEEWGRRELGHPFLMKDLPWNYLGNAPTPDSLGASPTL